MAKTEEETHAFYTRFLSGLAWQREHHAGIALRSFKPARSDGKHSMFIKNQQDFKATTSALRRELKALFPESALSHAQTMELLAKSLGFKSFAELQPVLPAEKVQKSPKPAIQLPPKYPLLNLEGELDLVEAGEFGHVVYGKDFSELRGTVEDIRACVAGTSGGVRSPTDYYLQPEYDGGTDVNWDGQETQMDKDGFDVWLTDDGDSVSASACLLVPEGFDAEDEEGLLPVRESLVKVYADLAQEDNLVTQLLGQVKETGLNSELLAGLAGTIAFCLHRRELERLIEVLEPKLF